VFTEKAAKELLNRFSDNLANFVLFLKLGGPKLYPYLARDNDQVQKHLLQHPELIKEHDLYDLLSDSTLEQIGPLEDDVEPADAFAATIIHEIFEVMTPAFEWDDGGDENASVVVYRALQQIVSPNEDFVERYGADIAADLDQLGNEKMVIPQKANPKGWDKTNREAINHFKTDNFHLFSNPIEEMSKIYYSKHASTVQSSLNPSAINVYQDGTQWWVYVGTRRGFLFKNQAKAMARAESESKRLGIGIEVMTDPPLIDEKFLVKASDLDGRLLGEVLKEFKAQIDAVYPKGRIVVRFVVSDDSEIDVDIALDPRFTTEMWREGRDYKIRLDSRGGKQKLVSDLAHEVTHISQYYNGFMDYEFEKEYRDSTEKGIQYKDHYNERHDELATEKEARLVEVFTFLSQENVRDAVSVALHYDTMFTFSNRDYLKKAMRFGVSRAVLARFHAEIMHHDVAAPLRDMLAPATN
jgi:hypothetical protein